MSDIVSYLSMTPCKAATRDGFTAGRARGALPAAHYRSSEQIHPGFVGARRARHWSGLGFDESIACGD
jgi:hypothetical protein